MELFNEKILKANRQYGAQFIEDNKLYRLVCDKIADDLNDLTKVDFSVVADLCCRNGYLLQQLGKIGKINVAHNYDIIENIYIPGAPNYQIYSEESLSLPDNYYSLVVSPLNLHAINDLRGFLRKILNGLRNNGFFIGTMMGSNNLKELRKTFMEIEIEEKNQVSYRFLPFIDVKNAGSLLSECGFGNIVNSVYSYKFVYNSFREMLRAIKKMGEGNCLINKPAIAMGKNLFKKIEDYYTKNFSYDNMGKVYVNVEIIYMLAQKTT